tara:strand:- start:4642 stop:5226 length:585 start_codon:yes stop_codon:yes gene_type:complete
MANLFDQTHYADYEPAHIVAGDRIAWKRIDLGTDYPPADYSLTYSARLENNADSEIVITASEVGSEYIVELASTVSKNYRPGTYHWQAYITRTSDNARVTVDSGTFKVLNNRADSNADPRNHIRIVIDNIEAVIENRASKDQESYSIQGRSLARTPIADLIQLRNLYKSELVREERAERIKNGLGHSGIIKVRG